MFKVVEDLNIAIDIAFDIFNDIGIDIRGDIMNNQERGHFREMQKQLRTEKHCMHHRHNWLRHNAMVPKGFLRYQVLSALNDKPMSGSEIMEEISKKTDGNWKPSPGSIYPMLAWLQDNTYIKELPTEGGLKRYEITQSGKEFFEEETKFRDKFREQSGFMAFPFFDRTYSHIPPEKSAEIRTTMKRLFTASVNVGKTLKENYSEKDLNESIQLLNETAEKLEQINKKLKGNKT